MYNIQIQFAFLGETKLPVDYEIEYLRNGASSSTRAVRARQENNILVGAQMSFCPMKVCLIYFKSLQFQKYPTFINHQVDIPSVQPPESCQTRKQLYHNAPSDQTLHPKTRDHFNNLIDSVSELCETRLIDPNMVIRERNAPAVFQQWIRWSENCRGNKSY
jgi:acyl-CoA thioesterase II